MTSARRGADDGTAHPRGDGTADESSDCLSAIDAAWPVVDEERHDPTSALLLVGVTVAFVAIAETPAPGVIAGAATVLAWYVAGTPYAIAIGHVALAALAPTTIDPVAIAAVEAPFLGLVIVSARHRGRPWSFAAMAVVSAAGLGVAAWLTIDAQPLWVGALVTLALLALVAYGVHRYELVRLGLLPELAGSGEPAPIDERRPTERRPAHHEP